MGLFRDDDEKRRADLRELNRLTHKFLFGPDGYSGPEAPGSMAHAPENVPAPDPHNFRGNPLLAPVPMRHGETVEQYRTRLAHSTFEVRLVDGRGRSRIVNVPHGVEAWDVGGVIFTYCTDYRLFDKSANRPVWMPKALMLRTQPETWPRWREHEAITAPLLTSEDVTMHRELDQWQAYDNWSTDDAPET